MYNDDNYNMKRLGESVEAVPADPLYDIDPRSPIFRGDILKWLN